MAKATPTYQELIAQARRDKHALDAMERKLGEAVARAKMAAVPVKARPLGPRDMSDDYHRPYGMPRPAATAPVRASDVRAASRQHRRVIARGSRPNAGLEAMYQQKLETKVGEMNASVIYWLRSAYRNNPPRMAQDGNGDSGPDMDHSSIPHRNSAPAGDGGDMYMALDRSPASILKAAFDKLAKRWLHQFEELSSSLGEWFTTAAAARSDAVLGNMLRRGGFAVAFKPTPEMLDIAQATINENVALIKSIPAQYLTQVEGSVMRSVTAGRDLASLTTELREHYGVTKRRAKVIAHQQNNAATAAFTRARQVEHGLEAIWMHSSAGKTFRPTHVKNSGKKYDPATGWWDPAERKYIWPGMLIGCKCYTRTIIPGFEH